MVPDDLFKKLPKFGQIITGIAKEHLCRLGYNEKIIMKFNHKIFFQAILFSSMQKRETS
jgi:hypothetical protein